MTVRTPRAPAPLLPLPLAARKLGFSWDKVRDLVRRGVLHAEKLDGTRWYIDPASVDALVRAQRKETT